MSGIITLTTDWGIGDPYAALFKAHVWRLCPQAVFADISHNVHVADKLHAAYLLNSACWAFPSGTVHVADVRCMSDDQQQMFLNEKKRFPFMDYIGVRCADQYFLMENNGILSLLASESKAVVEVVHLTADPDFNSYNTFNALNHYVYAASRLAAGGSLSELGEPYPAEKLERVVLTENETTENSVKGHVQHIDARGNLITDIRGEVLKRVADGRLKMRVSVGGCFERLNNVLLKKRYLYVPSGRFFAVVNTGGFVELGQKDSSMAAVLYGPDDILSGIGDDVTLSFE